MTIIEHKYFEHPDVCIRHLEWYAFQHILFDKDWNKLRDAIPEYDQRPFHWLDHFQRKAKDIHHQLKSKLYKKDITSMDEFYSLIDKLLKPKSLGKALKDKKQRTAQSAYQREQLGDAFIDNNKLLSKAKQSAFQLAEVNADRDMIVTRANELVKEHSNEALSDEQLNTLITYIEKQINNHLKLDRVEASIIDTDDKSMYFMWGKIKRDYPVGDTFTWTTKEAAAKCGCSRTNVAPIMKRLEKLGAVTLIQAGKAGANSTRAALYRRDA